MRTEDAVFPFENKKNLFCIWKFRECIGWSQVWKQRSPSATLEMLSMASSYTACLRCINLLLHLAFCFGYEYYTSASLQLQYDTTPPCLEPEYVPWRRPEGQAVSLLYNAKRELPGQPGPAPQDECRRRPALMSDETPKKALKSRALLQFLS